MRWSQKRGKPNGIWMTTIPEDTREQWWTGECRERCTTVATSSGSLVYNPRQYRRQIGIRIFYLSVRAGMYLVEGFDKLGHVDILMR